MDLKLPSELDAALKREARRMRQPKRVLVQRAVEPYLEECSDARAVRAARRQGGKPIPWSRVRR